MYMPHIKFQDSSISGSRISQLPSITDRQTDGRTDGRTDRPKPICPLNFSEVGGIKKQTFNSESIIMWPLYIYYTDFVSWPFHLIDSSLSGGPLVHIFCESKESLKFRNTSLK